MDSQRISGSQPRKRPSAAFANFSQALHRVMHDRFAQSPAAQERIQKAFRPLNENLKADIRRTVMRYLNTDPGSSQESEILQDLAPLLGVPAGMQLFLTVISSEDPSIDGKLRGTTSANTGMQPLTIPFVFDLVTCTFDRIDDRTVELPYGNTTVGLPPALALEYFRALVARRVDAKGIAVH